MAHAAVFEFYPKVIGDMAYCQNCGQVNAESSVFCRFCGTKFAAGKVNSPAPVRTPPVFPPTPQPMPRQNDYDIAPPRAYSWKTDEFQISDEKPTKVIDRVQPIPVMTPQNAAVPEHYQHQQMTTGYQCPRCSSRLYPKITRQISTAGWIVFAVLLVTFFPLFWIGFLIKEDIEVCQICGHRTRT